jgi:hypothetical protein
MNGWFADAEAIKRFVLGDCRCPGKPHDEDWMDVRCELSGQDLAHLEEAAGGDRLRILVAGWNLRNDQGDIPLEGAPFDRLYLDVFSRLNDWLNDNAQVAALPNESGAPSLNGSRGSASQTRTIRQRR